MTFFFFWCWKRDFPLERLLSDLREHVQRLRIALPGPASKQIYHHPKVSLKINSFSRLVRIWSTHSLGGYQAWVLFLPRVSPLETKQTNQLQKDLARWWFQHMFYLHPDPWGNVIQFDMRIFFQMGWFNHQLAWCSLEDEVHFPGLAS